MYIIDSSAFSRNKIHPIPTKTKGGKPKGLIYFRDVVYTARVIFASESATLGGCSLVDNQIVTFNSYL